MIFRRALRQLLPKRLALAVRREWLARRVASGHAYREHDVELLSRFVRPGDVCWDIGASSGTYTRALSMLGARVYAFEPIPDSFAILAKVSRRAKLKDVAMRQLAVADFVGAARMAVPTDGFYGGYYLAALDDSGDVSVQVTTVDQLVSDGVPEPDFVKCDVEGVELRVLAGARALIGRRPPVWLLETFEEEVLVVARSLGYRTFATLDNDEIGEVDRRTEARNYWLVPRSGLSRSRH
jgi:FkbM family methyltransferase